MKIIIDEIPKTTPKEVIQNRITEYHKKGKEIKSEIREDKIVLFYIEDDEMCNVQP